MVTLEADEVHCHGNGAIAVAIKGFDVIQQVSKKLVAPFEHTQSHDMMLAHVLHDISGQTFSSVGVRRSQYAMSTVLRLHVICNLRVH